MSVDSKVNKLFKGKSLMITGGTGSFGKTVLQRFLKTDIKDITIFSRDEKNTTKLYSNNLVGQIKYLNNKITGEYFYKGKVSPSSNFSMSKINADKLWNKSLEISAKYL